jgi:hypothetical protein
VKKFSVRLADASGFQIAQFQELTCLGWNLIPVASIPQKIRTTGVETSVEPLLLSAF